MYTVLVVPEKYGHPVSDIYEFEIIYFTEESVPTIKPSILIIY